MAANRSRSNSNNSIESETDPLNGGEDPLNNDNVQNDENGVNSSASSPSKPSSPLLNDKCTMPTALPKIRLVPIDNLLNDDKHQKNSSTNKNAISLDSSSDDDDDDDEPLIKSKQLPKTATKTHEQNKHVDSKYDVTVKLDSLPKSMESILEKFHLSEIRDHKSRIIASKKPSSSTKNKILSSSDTDKSDDEPNKNDSDSDTILKRRMKRKSETLMRRAKRKKVLLSNSSNSDSDSPAEKKELRMRKKNPPKSSNDYTDPSSSQQSSSSDDDNEENDNRNKSSDEEFRPRANTGKRRIVRPKKSDSDDDSSYNGTASKPKRRKRIRKNSSDSSDDGNTPKKHGRKNIRKVIRTQDLEDETKEAAQREKERKKRIEERQKLFNEMYDTKLEEIKELDKLVLDFDPDKKKELLAVDEKLVKKLKPHQAQGVKFMWDACFESIEKLNENNGGGCILAHCMGLGKTLQVVTLVHTLLTNSDKTNVEKVLVICPVSTVLNWVNEFRIWLRHCAHNRDIEVYEISKYKQNVERANRIQEWHEEGGVLILGYDMFRNLSSETNRARKKQKEAFQKGLIDPGADLVVCDEGHLLKNAKTSLSKAVNRIRTLRRIVLTGTPLQNNLNEYYCMVQFVKPNLLGKYNEYLNRFVNPITNGQYTDSTPYDIQMMKRRSHILHKLLDGCVQRRDYAVLAPFLPPKQEYVLYIRLTQLQIDLYKFYMQHRPVQLPGKTRSAVLFQDFQNLQRIWTHPQVLRYNSDRYEQMIQKKKFLASDDEEGSLKDFIDDDDDASDTDDSSSDASSSSSNSSSVQSVNSDEPSHSKKKTQQQSASRRTRANAKDFEDEPIEPVKEDNPTEWWKQLVPEEELNNMEYSGKLILLFSILAECEACGDKLLVFSQSLFSLDVIEYFLSMIDENTQNPDSNAKLAGFTGSWTKGIDYFRLDGSTHIETRNSNCNVFNHESNTRARLFLISTRAGGLGINLVAANRVIIFDASWNPSHDIQSIFRVYRFGQKKPCYIYRFIAMGTMEEKIYERQVTKLAISKRVIDEHQIDRHYKENDLMELYNIDCIDLPESERPPAKLPKDRLFAEQLQKYPNIIFKYHEHDSLLENKSDETLSKEEIDAAWKEFEEEKNRPTVAVVPTLGYPTYQPPGTAPVTSNNIFGFRTDILLQLLNIKARRMYPGTENTSAIVPTLLKHLYETMDKNDTSFYQELLYIQQTEMASPSPGSYLTPSGHVMPAYSGRGRPPLNPQHSAMHMQQQRIMQQNNIMMNNGNVRLPAPTQVSQIIEID